MEYGRVPNQRRHGPSGQPRQEKSPPRPIDGVPFDQRPILQRCACGGACPACRGEESGLKVGKPGDRFEREADQTAGRVMRMPESGGPSQEIEEEEIVQRQPLGGEPPSRDSKQSRERQRPVQLESRRTEAPPHSQDSGPKSEPG